MNADGGQVAAASCPSQPTSEGGHGASRAKEPKWLRYDQGAKHFEGRLVENHQRSKKKSRQPIPLRYRTGRRWGQAQGLCSSKVSRELALKATITSAMTCYAATANTMLPYAFLPKSIECECCCASSNEHDHHDQYVKRGPLAWIRNQRRGP